VLGYQNGALIATKVRLELFASPTVFAIAFGEEVVPKQVYILILKSSFSTETRRARKQHPNRSTDEKGLFLENSFCAGSTAHKSKQQQSQQQKHSQKAKQTIETNKNHDEPPLNPCHQKYQQHDSNSSTPRTSSSSSPATRARATSEEAAAVRITRGATAPSQAATTAQEAAPAQRSQRKQH